MKSLPPRWWQGWKPLIYSVARRYCMAKRFHLSMPLFAWYTIPACVSHSSPWVATAVKASACQQRWWEWFICPCLLSVRVLQNTWCARQVYRIHIHWAWLPAGFL